jgi:LysR family transcriptional regulator, regulator of abg operon
MQLNQLRNFIAMVDAGSIRAAARRLGISQPAATKSLRALEQELDAVLVQRNTRGVTLTDAGKAFAGRARAVQSELQRAKHELAQLAGQRNETVSVGVASVVGSWLIPPVLSRYREDRPDTSVRVVEGTQETLLPLLREGSLDFAVCLRMEPESTAGFVVRPLAKFRMMVVGRKGHPKRQARSLAELADAHWLMSRPRGAMAVLEHAFSAEGLTIPMSATECDSHAIKVAILAASDSLAVLSKPMLGEPSVQALLEEIPLDRPFPLMTFSLYSRAETRPSSAARGFAAVLSAQCRQILRMAP